MCNYRPYAIYHLPKLKELDAFTISPGERQLAEVIIVYPAVHGAMGSSQKNF